MQNVNSSFRDRNVIDISEGNIVESLKLMLKRDFLEADPGKRRLPAALLSDETGLQLWSQITFLPDYYYTRTEISLIDRWGTEIAQNVPVGCTIIDLGSGNIRKVKHLLDKLEALGKEVQYFALDLSRTELEKSMVQLPSAYRFVKCFGLWGTFDNARTWSKAVTGPKWFLSLGGIFGNDPFEKAVAGLKKWSSVMRPEDRLLLAMDAQKDKKKVAQSFHDSQGIWHKFIRNGCIHSNRILEASWYRDEDWAISNVCEDKPRHNFFVLRALKDVKLEAVGLNIPVGEEIIFYDNFKYDQEEMHKQYVKADLSEIAVWKAPEAPLYQYLLSVRPPDAVLEGTNFQDKP